MTGRSSDETLLRTHSRPVAESAPSLSWAALLRVALALLGIFCCYRLAVKSVTIGYARLLCTTAIIESRIEPADGAVSVAPQDPEAHYTRALTLVNAQKLGEAVEEFRQAIQLRPHHYYQWLDLGVTLDRLNDARGAEQALRRSVDLAPAFAQPHWQLGNFLFRDNRYDEAFEQLRLGARGNAGEFQSLLDLAWLAADGNVASFEDFVRPEDQLAHLKTARDLVGHGKGAESVWHLKAGGPPVNEDNAAVLREIISQLISNKQFSAAYEAWLVNHADFPNDVRGEGIVLNGDFNYAIAQNDPGFNWQFLRGNAIAVSIDPAGAVPGTRSVHLDLSGETAPEAILLSELVLVQPNTRYSLGFMFKTRELVTGGPPRIVVMANGADGKETLGESRTLAPGTSEWQQDTVNFSTRADTSAIVVALQRRSCSQSPCPIFGGIWLGRVSLSRGK